MAVGFIFTQGTKNHSDCWRSTEVTRGMRSVSAGNLCLDVKVGVFTGRLALQMPTKHTQLTNVFSSNVWRTMTYWNSFHTVGRQVRSVCLRSEQDSLCCCTTVHTATSAGKNGLLNHGQTEQPKCHRVCTTWCPWKNYNPRQCKIEMSNVNASKPNWVWVCLIMNITVTECQIS